MIVIDRLIKRIGYFSYQYHGESELATPDTIRFIVENSKDIDGMLAASKSEIKTIYDLKKFFFANKYKHLNEIVEKITNEDFSKIVKSIADKCDKYVSSIGVGQIKKYVALHYKDLFSGRKFDNDLAQATLNVILESHGGIKMQVWLYIANKYEYKLIKEYKLTAKIINEEEGGEKLLKKILRFENNDMELLSCYNLSEKLGLLSELNKNKKNGKIESEVTCLKCSLDASIKKLDKNTPSEFLFERQNVFQLYGRFLDSVQDGKANSFQKIINKTEKQLKEYVIMNGAKMEYRIPIDEMVEKWRETPDVIKVLSITHRKLFNDGRMYFGSQLYRIDLGEPSIIGRIIGMHKAYEELDYDKQHMLQCAADIRSGLVRGILRSKEDAHKLLRLLLPQFKLIENGMQCIASDNIAKDFEAWMLSTELLIKNSNAGKNEVFAVCYPVAMLSCFIIEKLLKSLKYVLVGESDYIDNKHQTLSSLLVYDDSNVLSNALGEEYLKNLSFFLSTLKKSGIGLDVRNKLAHLTDNIEEDIDFVMTSRIIWLMIDVVNTICIYLSEK